MELTNIQADKLEVLKKKLSQLIGEYRSGQNLVNDQMQAVIYNDLIWLNSLIEQQLKKYERLMRLEEGFKSELQGLYDTINPGASHYSLTKLVEELKDPSSELDRLRDELRGQVEKTQDLREQLMDLLRFARGHNARTFEELFSLTDQKSELYDAAGSRQKANMQSVAINQKA